MVWHAGFGGMGAVLGQFAVFSDYRYGKAGGRGRRSNSVFSQTGCCWLQNMPDDVWYDTLGDYFGGQPA